MHARAQAAPHAHVLGPRMCSGGAGAQAAPPLLLGPQRPRLAFREPWPIGQTLPDACVHMAPTMSFMFSNG